MEVFLLWIAGILSVLSGCVSCWLFWKLYSGSSDRYLRAIQEAKAELESLKRRLEAEWEDTYQRMMSIAGRMDRATGRGRPRNGIPPELVNPMAELENQILQRRGNPLSG